jgi:uncharacterized protein (TIGR00725 family)
MAVGLMGSASGEIDPDVAQSVRRMGRAVAEAGCVLITGGCPGLPHDAVLGAHEAGGLVIGISPALSESEHVTRYGSPTDGFDVLIYTGSGLMGREVVNIRSSDIVLIVGGQSGTLGEFSIAYDEGRLIGVLQGSGGIADLLPQIIGSLHKNTGSVVIYDTDPERLVGSCIDYYESEHFRHPHVFHANGPVDARPKERQPARLG